MTLLISHCQADYMWAFFVVCVLGYGFTLTRAKSRKRARRAADDWALVRARFRYGLAVFLTVLSF